MTDSLQHECGIALVRLLQPLEHYQARYGTWMYGLQKLYLLMEKQHNRGQDGAGVAGLKLNTPPGHHYIDRVRSNHSLPIQRVFDQINGYFAPWQEKPERLHDAHWAKHTLPFASELYLGHLRYGTYGAHTIDFVHPVMRENNWKSRNLVLAGNFNLTNTPELFHKLIALGQHPKDYSDTVTVLEKLGHFLDEENQRLFRHHKDRGVDNSAISALIAQQLDVGQVLAEATKDFDGGYAIAGLIGHGDAFVCRDPWGIRPAFYYQDEEVVVVASERPVIQTVMNVAAQLVREVPHGHALVVKSNGQVELPQVRAPQPKASCSFERIYFSRGTDQDIYRERMRLGEYIAPAVLEAVGWDVPRTVFSFIPNTAETAYYGLIKGVEKYMNRQKTLAIQQGNGALTDAEIEAIIAPRPRIEKIAVKDVKLRTFIAQDKGRKDLVGHVYDITYGTLRPGMDNLVVIDDSIVRGTTLRESILAILDRLAPRMIVVVSSSPQVRYPDCYGIDMTRLGDFVAFRAALELLGDTGQQGVIDRVYRLCQEQAGAPGHPAVNHVKEIYRPFTDAQLSERIARILTPKNMSAQVKIVYQSVENLNRACPDHRGDWYFTGNYPTPGGNRVANTAFINFIEGKSQRPY